MVVLDHRKKSASLEGKVEFSRFFLQLVAKPLLLPRTKLLSHAILLSESSDICFIKDMYRG